MKYNYIVIEREFGSGGTLIGRKLAEECNFFFYGKEILEEAARKLNTSVEQLQQYEENSKGSFLYSIAMLGRIGSGEGDFLTGEDYIYLEEQSVIRRLAQNGPSVFMGHCAAKALENQEGVLKVFIHANEAEKKRRTEEDYQIPKEQAEEVMHKFNRKRSNYYSVNTGKKWTDLNNYDVVLDSGTLGIEKCVEILKNIIVITPEN